MGVADLAARLPDVATVRRWSISLAVLDAIMEPRAVMRYFTYEPAWGSSTELASMRNGSGDEYSIMFSSAGAYVRGFDHESSLSPWGQSPPAIVPGLVDGVPDAFRSC